MGPGRGKDGTNEIQRVDLHEVGPCLVGANDEAQLVGVKSATRTADREIAGISDEELRAYLDRAIGKKSRRVRFATFEVK